MENLITAIKETNWTDFYTNHVSFDFLKDGSTHIKIDNEVMVTIGRSQEGY